MPTAEDPEAKPEGEPDKAPLAENSGAAAGSGKAAYDKGANADHGGGKAALDQKRKDELPKSVVDDF